jgi:DNA-binding beta-propeller fold protein YncE
VPAFAQVLVVSQQTGEVLEYDVQDGSFEGVFANTISDGFRTPGAIAIRPSDGALYISSIATGQIWSYDGETGLPLLPAVASGLFAPFGIDFDEAGSNLYFADAATPEAELTNAVKQLDVGSGVVTLVGTHQQADFLAVAVNGSEVFATDVALGRVIAFPVSGGSGSVEISSGLSMPAALLFPTAGQMLVADSGNDRVVEYRKSGGSWIFERVVLAATAGVIEPSGLSLAADGRLSVSGRSSGDVVLVDLTTLALSEFIEPGAGGLSDPVDVTWGAGRLYVASRSGNAVFSFDESGHPGVRAEGRSAPLDAGIHLSPDGSRLFVTSIGGNDVVEFDVASGARVRIFVQACPNLPLPFDSVLGADSRLYVSCTLNHSVEYFDASNGASLGSFVLAGSGGLVSPRSLAFGPNGNLFVANGTGAVLEFDGTTGSPVLPGPFIDANANGGGPLDAYSLEFHQGVLYVASLQHDEVMAFDATGGGYLSTFVASGSGGLSGPQALAHGPGGDLYVAGGNDDTIRRYDGATGAFMEVFVAPGSGGLAFPFDFVIASATPSEVPALDWVARGALLAMLWQSGLWHSRWRRRRGEAR